jgi:hypothetical protein
MSHHHCQHFLSSTLNVTAFELTADELTADAKTGGK